MGLKNLNIIGVVYGLFPWSSKLVLSVYPRLPEVLKEADIKVYPEAYAATVGLFTIIGLFLSIGGIPFLALSIYAPQVLGLLSMVPYYTYIIFILMPGLVLLLGIAIPKVMASNRASSLEAEVPFLSAYVSVMSTGGISPYISIERLKNFRLLPNMSKEAKRITLWVGGLGLDPVAAIEESAKSLPSKEYRELLLGYSSTLRAGGDVVHYLLTKTKDTFENRLTRLRILGERMSGMLEIYVTFSVLLALGFYTIYIVSLTMAAYIPIGFGASFVLFTYIFLPMISVMFLYMIDILQPKYPSLRLSLAYKVYYASIPFMLILIYLMVVPFMLPEAPYPEPLTLIKDFVVYVSQNLLRLERGFEAPVGFCLAFLISTLPAATVDYIHNRHMKQVEGGVTDFLRDVVEIRKTGMSPENCIVSLAERDYGRFSKYLRVISNQVGWGIPLTKVVEGFIRRVDSWLANITMYLLVDAIEVGGGSPETLDSLARFSEMIEAVEKEKDMRIKPLLMVPYIGALTFVVSTVILLGFMRSTLSLVGTSIAYSQFVTTLLTPMIAHVYLTGLVAGKISSGRVSGGFVHAVILIIATIISIVLSPMLSMPLQLTPVR
ncbi:type II secretion system F family protein [Candidatus Bathyarchaeota archaeon]|nr:type II secretion system F family protein [Candidatus Bathyarchaeota archaeon]MBS7618342.1 type II secretion system F family protein [Candidatus Bathyarchaeota archaeon]